MLKICYAYERVNGMRTKNTQKNAQNIYEQLWLTYFNDVLYAKGLITEDQRNKLRIRIKTRPAASGK